MELSLLAMIKAHEGKTYNTVSTPVNMLSLEESDRFKKVFLH